MVAYCNLAIVSALDEYWLILFHDWVESGEVSAYMVRSSRMNDSDGNGSRYRTHGPGLDCKTCWFGFRPSQKPDPPTHGGPNPDPYLSTRGFRRVWLDHAVPIPGSACRVSHLWSHSDMPLLIVQYWHWYCMVHFRRISHLDVQSKHTQAPSHILKMSVHGTSTIFSPVSSVLWVMLDHQHSQRRIWQPLYADVYGIF